MFLQTPAQNIRNNERLLVTEDSLLWEEENEPLDDIPTTITNSKEQVIVCLQPSYRVTHLSLLNSVPYYFNNFVEFGLNDFSFLINV